jgi:CDP-glycerol glycerophosphotransferase
MLNNDEFKEYTHVWILSNIENRKKMQNTKYIKRNSLKNAYYLLSSKYLINNTTFLTFFTKSKKQIYINTWHGTPLKTLGKDSNLGYGIHWNVARNLLQTDYIISSNKYTTEKLLNSSDIETLYHGKIIENGYPRNDFLQLSKQKKEELKLLLNINNNKKIILYAPTFRGSHRNSDDHNKIFIEFIRDLRKNFSDDYNILIKLHHINNNTNEDILKTKLLDSIDTNKLLSIVDILISDYSSISFDFLPLKRPIIYYAFDLHKYEKDRGFYYSLENMPGVICTRKQEVYDTINNIQNLVKDNIDSYNKCINKFSKYESAETSKKNVEAIFLNKKENINIYSIKKNHKKKILIYGGAFMLNGVTSSLLALLSNISFEKFEIYIITDLDSSNSNLRRVLNIIPKSVKIIYVKQYLLKHVLFISRISNIIFTTKQKDKISKYVAYNILGDSQFDIAIDYSGYGIYWASIIAYSNSSSKYIYLHSDIKSEFKNKRFKYYNQISKLYHDKFDRLIAVSSSSKNANKQHMPELSNKIECVHNSVDFNHIMNLSKKLESITDFIDLQEQKKLFAKDKINFINIGRYSVEKGQEDLIKAFALLKEEYENIHLFIVGYGPLYLTLKDLIHELNMKNNITLTGKMENPYALLKKCNCFILSSHYEGQGLVLLESLLLEVPCISTDIPGPRSVLSEDKGLLVPDTIDGLKYGMKSFIEGKVKYKEFNYKKYIDDSMNEFYNTIV